MMKAKKFKVTQEGFDKLNSEFKELREVKRPVVVARLQKAREMGDLSENSEYTSAKESLRFIDSRIVWIELRLRNAEVVAKDANNNFVSLGDSVILERDGQKLEYQIVGELEADIENKKLSTNSPIGKAVLGKGKGDEVQVATPSGNVVYKIINIS
ncbi:transcription elongation factor GreA [Candidatus Roizmanbacteria bacterium RIFCSPLOWO2_01_FULL_39_19]|nr:MAG: transcription elongation factor GreA [Candidatus Roizmanbacteria bacterium RIFCSPLOWO2_01_FULL_39_19]